MVATWNIGYKRVWQHCILLQLPLGSIFSALVRSMLVHPLFLLAGAVAASAANRYLPNGRMHANIPPTPMVPIIDTSDFGAPVTSRNGTELPPYNTTYEFDQLINHDDPSLGTFKQRFWHTYEFYEPGGPIILFTPGESNAQCMSLRYNV